MDAAIFQPITDATDRPESSGSAHPIDLTELSYPLDPSDHFGAAEFGLADLRPDLRLLVSAWRLQKRLDALSTRIDRARELLARG